MTGEIQDVEIGLFSKEKIEIFGESSAGDLFVGKLRNLEAILRTLKQIADVVSVPNALSEWISRICVHADNESETFWHPRSKILTCAGLTF